MLVTKGERGRGEGVKAQHALHSTAVQYGLCVSTVCVDCWPCDDDGGQLHKSVSVVHRVRLNGTKGGRKGLLLELEAECPAYTIECRMLLAWRWRMLCS